MSCFILPSSCFIVASPFIFMSHESPLQQQHDSIEQQLSVAFFWSVCEGVWAIPAVNAVSSKPRTRIRVVFLRDLIIVLLYQEISALHAGQNAPTRSSIQRQANRSLDQEDTTLQVGRSTVMKDRNNAHEFRLKRLFLKPW